MNIIHQSAIIDPRAIIGTGNKIGPYTFIASNVEIGDNNWIGPFVTIGSPPEHAQYLKNVSHLNEFGLVKIGNDNFIWEGSSIQSPTSGFTLIGSRNYLMHNSHVAHDCTIFDDAKLAPQATLGGNVKIHSGAHIGIGTAVHQNKSVGALTLVGMNSSVNLNLKPFSIYAGNPARFYKINAIGLARYGISKQDIQKIEYEVSKPKRDWNLDNFTDELIKLVN
jgi:UDP-N-acetylglucosamine acyltransferase